MIKTYAHATASTSGPNIIDREIETSWTAAKCKRIKGRFLKGPIPLAALQRAASLPGKSLVTYLAIRHRCDVQRTMETTLPTGYMVEWGVKKDAKIRALNHLANGNLIAIKRLQGRTTLIQLLCD
jgi:hypothetical protein